MAKKEKKDTPVKTTEGLSLDQLVKAFNSTYGPDTVVVASKAKGITNIPRIKTGIFSFDWATGGGIPTGRVTMFSGMKSAGKSTLAAISVAQAQRTCRSCFRSVNECAADKEKDHNTDPMRCVWVDAEGAYGSDWPVALGVDDSKLLLTRPTTAEQAIDITTKLLLSAKADLIVVDSLAALTPQGEMDGNSGEFQPGLHAKLLNQAMRLWNASVNRIALTEAVRPSLIVIQQIRYKIGIVYGNPEVKPGGMMQEYAHSLGIRLTAKPPVFVKEDNKVPVRVVSDFRIEKSKVSPAKIEGGFEIALRPHGYWRRGEIADYHQVAEFAKRHGVLVREGSAWGVPALDITGRTLDVVQAKIMEAGVFPEFKKVTLEAALGYLTGSTDEVVDGDGEEGDGEEIAK